MHRPWSRRWGLSLVELIVALNIVAIFVALSIPVYRTVRRRGHENACRSSLSVVWTGLERYRVDHNRYPFHLAELIPGYIASEKSLTCPADPRRGQQSLISAVETAGLNLLYVRRDIAETGEQIVCGCPFHSHSLVQFLDGRIATGTFQEAVFKSPVKASLLRREDLAAAPLSAETPLRAGDAVMTGIGGSGVLAFDEGTTVTLGENTQMVVKIALTAEQPSKLIRVLGMFANQVGGPAASALADVVDGVYDGGGGRFEIQTPTAVAGVHGTRFTVTVTQALVGSQVVRQTVVCPLSGEVEVKGNGKSKRLKPGDTCVEVTSTNSKEKDKGKGKDKGKDKDKDWS